MKYLFVTALVLCSSALAQGPKIAAGGVVNAASLAAAGLPNSGIAQGAQFAILGTNLGPAEAVQAAGFPYPTTDGLGGVTVKITAGESSVDAILVSVSEKRVVAVLPSTVQPGEANVTLAFNGESATAPIQVVPVNFGIFTRTQVGSGQATARNVAEDGTLTDNSVNAPAKPASKIHLLGTGLGAVQGDEAAGPISGDIAGDLDVYIGGKKATILAKGRSDSAAGLDRIELEVPQDSTGCFVSVAVRAGNLTSNFATIAISSTETCTDPNGFTNADLEKLRNATDIAFGVIGIGRTSVTAQGAEITAEAASASFSRTNVQAAASTGSGQPSVGSCLVLSQTEASAQGTVTVTWLDAGPSLTLTGPKGSRTLEKKDNVYSAVFAAVPNIPNLPPIPIPGLPQAFFDPGQYTVTGTGGADVGPFTARITLGQPLNWTNRATVGNSGPNTINRGADVEVTWTGGGPNDLITILGTSVILKPQVSASFMCMAPAPAGRFTVPSWVLSSLPVSPDGFLTVTLSGLDGNRFEAPGIDMGFAAASSSSSRQIAYQ